MAWEDEIMAVRSQGHGISVVADYGGLLALQMSINYKNMTDLSKLNHLSWLQYKRYLQILGI